MRKDMKIHDVIYLDKQICTIMDVKKKKNNLLSEK